VEAAHTAAGDRYARYDSHVEGAIEGKFYRRTGQSFQECPYPTKWKGSVEVADVRIDFVAIRIASPLAGNMNRRAR
jgi:hypothetical protein